MNVFVFSGELLLSASPHADFNSYSCLSCAVVQLNIIDMYHPTARDYTVNIH